MSKEEQILSSVRKQPALSFISSFLDAFPNANIFLVGGAVRDSLLPHHTQPVDFDFVVTGLAPDKMERWFAGRGTINLVGQHFGVYKFMPTGFTTKDVYFIDIALPRTESPSSDSLGGYRDSVVVSDPLLSIEDDLARRDFTINAIAFDLRHHLLIDPHHGQDDLQHKLIRAVGTVQDRFNEDLTRVLRAVRFSAQLSFTIEPETQKAIRVACPNINRLTQRDGKAVYVVAREIIGEELTKALLKNPYMTIQHLCAFGLLNQLLPDIALLTNQDEYYLSPLSRTHSNELPVVTALLFRGVQEDLLSPAFDLCGLSRQEDHIFSPKRCLTLVKQLQTIYTKKDIGSLRSSQFEKLFMGTLGLTLTRCLSLLGQNEVVTMIQNRRVIIQNCWLVDETEIISPLLSGQDVLTHGIPQGPEVRLLLDQARDRQLDGEILNREQAIVWLEKMASEKTKNPSS